MLETFTALLLAHVVADFVLQTDWMVRNKRRALVMLLHGALVLVTAQIALGQIAAPELLALAAAHMVIDALKTWSGTRSLAAFLADQSAHIATIAGAAVFAPSLWTSGMWSTGLALPGLPPLPPAPDGLPALMAVAAGAIATLRAGGFATGLLMAPFAVRIRNTGLPNAGRLIGTLERAVIFGLTLGAMPLGIGFLLTAKSILRFGTATRDQRSAEYVIIGTLASFGWALATSHATLALWRALENAPPTP